MACLVVLAGLIPLGGCATEGVNVPGRLLGVWGTDKTGYAGRTMEFLEDAVIFYSSEDTYTIHPIIAFRTMREERNERWRYDLVYTTNVGLSIDVTMYHDDSGTLVFDHQRAVRWRRRG